MFNQTIINMHAGEQQVNPVEDVVDSIVALYEWMITERASINDETTYYETTDDDKSGNGF